MCGSDIFLGIVAIFFPPFAVWVKRGICSADSCINIALCILGFIPGLLHAWYIIASTPAPTYEEVAQQDAERGNVTYYYVEQQQPQYAPQGGAQRSYGTVNNSTPSAQFPGHKHGFVQLPAQPKAHRAPAPASGAPAAGPAQTEGESGEQAPPSYAQVVKGDNKVQEP